MGDCFMRMPFGGVPRFAFDFPRVSVYSVIFALSLALLPMYAPQRRKARLKRT
jgi:hypothetical protein